MFCFFILQNFKNTHNFLTAEKPQTGPNLGVSCLTHLHCKTTKLLYMYMYMFGLKRSHLKIGVNGAVFYNIPWSVSKLYNGPLRILNFKLFFISFYGIKNFKKHHECAIIKSAFQGQNFSQKHVSLLS